MTEISLEPRVRTVVAMHLDVDPDRLQAGARLGEDLCVDSLAAIDMAMVLEDEFDITLPEEVLGGVRTYGDVVSVVQSRVDSRTEAADTPA